MEVYEPIWFKAGMIDRAELYSLILLLVTLAMFQDHSGGEKVKTSAPIISQRIKE